MPTAVLDGGVAVRCNPKPALAGLKSRSRSCVDRPTAGRAARLDPLQDDVLEVGPGLGVLTERLARAARRVIAVELDQQLAEWLRTEFPTVDVVTADVLQLDIAARFQGPFVVVANLPYHI